MGNVTQIEEAIQTIFGAADQLARETHFVQRVKTRQIHGQEFCRDTGLGEARNGEK